MADDARRAGDTLLHDRAEPAVGFVVGVLQHLVQVRAVGADQQHVRRLGDLNGGDRVGAAAGRCRRCTADRHGTGGGDRQCRERQQWQERNRRRGGKRWDGGESYGRGDDGCVSGHLLDRFRRGGPLRCGDIRGAGGRGHRLDRDPDGPWRANRCCWCSRRPLLHRRSGAVVVRGLHGGGGCLHGGGGSARSGWTVAGFRPRTGRCR